MKLKRVVLNGLVLGTGLALILGSCCPPPEDNKVVGYLVDSPIEGVDYDCIEEGNGTTDKDGKFECNKLPVTFKIGGLELGSVSSLSDDSKVYPQDLVGVSRENFTDNRLILLTRFLQSLDDDGIISERITIEKEIGEKFSITEFSDLSEDEVKDLLTQVDKNLVGRDSALSHLQDNLLEEEAEPNVPVTKESRLSYINYLDSKLNFKVDIKGLGISKEDKIRVALLPYSDQGTDINPSDEADNIVEQTDDYLKISIHDFSLSLMADSKDMENINQLPLQDRSSGMFEIIGERPYQGLSVCIAKVTKDNGHEINGQTYYGNVVHPCVFVADKNYVIHSPFSMKSIRTESVGNQTKVIVETEGKLHENIIGFFQFIQSEIRTLPYMNSLAKVYPTKESETSFSFIMPDKIQGNTHHLVVATFGKDGYSRVSDSFTFSVDN